MSNGIEDFVLQIKDRAMEELFADYELHGVTDWKGKHRYDGTKEYLKKVSEIKFPEQCSTHTLVNKMALALMLVYVKRLEEENKELGSSCDIYWETICDLIDEKEALKKEKEKKKHWFSRKRK